MIGVCPSCGYCPSCGRGGRYEWPHRHPWLQPVTVSMKVDVADAQAAIQAARLAISRVG